MPRRSLLSAEQRTRLFAVPTAPAEMARHYVLGPEDLLLMRAERRALNRLGFAVQLCLLRHPGQGLGPGQRPPAAMLDFVAAQLGIPSAAFADYARRDQTRREHAIELQALLGLRSFRLGDWRDCLRVGTDAAWATDRGEPIVQAMLAHLRARGVLVPDPAVLERIGLTARARARQCTFQALADGVTEAEQAALDGLLVTDPAVRRSRFTWRRDAPEAPAPGNMVALLDRLDWVRSVGITQERTARVHPARLARLVEEGGIMTAQHLAHVEPLRRTALLVAGVIDLETQLSDATLAMFCKYVGSLFTKARGRDERRFQATRRDVARTLLLFRRTIAALKHAKESGEEGVAAVEREVGLGRLDQALPVIDAVAGVADVEILATAAERYAVLRRFSPRFLAAFRFQSSVPHDPSLAAIDLLKAADETGARALSKRLPSAFLPPKWRRMIFAGPVPDRRLYETAVLAILRDRLRGAGVWVAGSRDHRAFEDYLLPAEPAGVATIGLAGETDPERYLAARADLLHERLQFAATCATRGELDGVEIEDGTLYIARTKPTVPDAARLLAGRLYGMMPRVRVTEVVEGDVTGSGGSIELGNDGASSRLSGSGPVTLEVGGAVGSGEFVLFDAPNATLLLDDPEAFAARIVTFGAGDGDAIALAHETASALTLDFVDDPNPSSDGFGGTLEITEGTTDIADIRFFAQYDTSDFLIGQVGDDAVVTLVCYVPGTRIAVPGGQTPIEEIRPGDLVRLATGGSAPVRWVGRRRIDCRLHGDPAGVLPVRVRRGAFGSGLPFRDLVLSPQHAVFFEGCLFPIIHLVDGRGIVQEQVDRQVYLHVELDRHGILIAEGLPAASYLDTGNRAMFANAALAGSSPGGAAEPCAPMIVEGPRLARLRDHLAAIAASATAPVQAIHAAA